MSSYKYYVYISHNADFSLYYIGSSKCVGDPLEHKDYGPETSDFKPVGKRIMGVYANKLDAEDYQLELMFRNAAIQNPKFVNK